MPTESPALVSTAQVAEQRRVTVKTVLRWVATGKLTPAVKMPGKTGAYLFTRESVDALTESHEVAS
jgi:excisionase family DNA binding protein